MKNIKLLIVVFILMLSANRIKAQVYGQDVNGSALREKRYLDVNGSPYLVDTWEKAVVQLNNGQTYNVDIKYDMIADNIYFRNKAGDSLNFAQPVKEFKIAYTLNNKAESRLFRSGFPSTGGKTNQNSFYEVLYDGTTKLIKKDAKSIWEETTTYGTATKVKNITDHVTYFVARGDKIVLLKNDRKSVTEALNDKAADIEKYIKDNKLDAKKDDDLIKIFTYYNSL